MRSDGRWNEKGDPRNYMARERLRGEEYQEDRTARQDGLPMQWMVAAAIAAAGVGLYKSGALRSMIHAGIREAGEYRGNAGAMIRGLKAWSIADDAIPNNSIFRRELNSLKKIGQAAKDWKIIQQETMQDLRGLSTGVKESMEAAARRSRESLKLSLNDTELGYELGQIKTMQDAALTDARLRHLTKDINLEVSEALLKDRNGNPALEMAQEALKRSGFRKATLGDVFTPATIDGKKTLVSRNADFMADTEFRDRLVQQMSRTHMRAKNSMDTEFMIDRWDEVQHLTFDKNLLIDSAGEIRDLRPLSNDINSFMRSASLDFHVPLVNLRPMEMLGIHNRFGQIENKYGFLDASTFQPVLTGQAGRVALGNGGVFVKGNVFQGDDQGNLLKTASRGNLLKIQDEDDIGYGISRKADSLRKMANLNTIHHRTFTEEDGVIKHTYSRIMEWLGLGFQDKKSGNAKLDMQDPLNSVFNMLGKYPLFKPWKTQTVIPMNKAFGEAKSGPTFVFMNNTRKIKDVFEKTTTMEEFFAQAVAGRSNLKNVTGATIGPYHMLDRLSNSLHRADIFGITFGLKTEDLGSTGDVLKNLLVKRVLPIYLGIQGWQYLNMEGEKLTGTQPEDLIANVAVKADLGWHGIKDAIGLTAMAKRFSPLMPGLEQITEIPLLGGLEMDKTKEEKEEWYRTGEVAVRKGRFWPLGNTPFTGGKTEYYAPNWYRRTISDYKFSDSQHGSREEYFKNAPIPTPRYPFAPIRHFFADPYHWEQKHYEDRPYMLTAPLGENLPIIGPMVGATIGQILKPQRRMHPEAWAPEEAPLAADSGSAGKATVSLMAPGITGVSEATGLPEAQKEAAANARIPGDDSFVVPTSPEGTRPVPAPVPERAKTKDMIYVTPSGRPKAIRVDQFTNVEQLNQDLRERSIKKIQGADEKRGFAGPQSTIPRQQSSGLRNVLNDQLDVFSEVGGIYGFGANTLFGTGTDVGDFEIESASYATSLSKEFWDSDLGGLGGEFSEIYRRFVPKRRRNVEYYNPIRNTQPEWMPGADYFTDYQHGDPYLKIKRGEARLPGEGYERLYGLDPISMKVGASVVGKSTDDLVRYLLHLDGTQVSDEDSGIQKKFISAWKKEGILIDSNVSIDDPRNNIMGGYDARLVDEKSETGDAIAEIKVVSQKRFEEAKKSGGLEEHKRQLNYYLGATQRRQGYLFYVNADNLEENAVISRRYDHKMFKDTQKNLSAAREVISSGLQSGTIKRGDLYSPFDRYRILADTAPYSKEFREAKAILDSQNLSKEQIEEKKEIRQQMLDRNKPVRLYPYKFATANLRERTVTVTRKIDNETFMTEEFPDNPITIAGVSLPDSPNSKEGEAANRMVNSFIHKGARVRIGVDADPLGLIENNTYKTIKAVVYKNGVNVNRRLLQSGVAKAKEDDADPASIRAQYSGGEIAFGAAWERISHMNTIFNTKLMQTRSAIESYERRDLYGKDFQRWETPIKSFLEPALNVATNSPIGILGAAIVGSLFGAKPYAKLIGAVVGAGVVGASKIYKTAYEVSTREKWVPERRRKERELNEYMDVLKFIKNRKLYQQYKEKSMKQEHFDVERFMEGLKSQGDDAKKRSADLKRAKRQVQTQGDKAVKDLYEEFKPKYAEKKMDAAEFKKAINKELLEASNQRRAIRVPKYAQKAIEYYNQAEKTMYGYDPGEPLENILAAIPKTERKYLAQWLKAPEEERMRILEQVPGYVRRVLQQSWGLPAEKKPDLTQYFRKRQLPGLDWAGWKEDISLDDVRVKMIQNEALDVSDFNIWEDDLRAAEAAGPIPLPRMTLRGSAEQARASVEALLHSLGLTEVDVSYDLDSDDVEVSINLKKDKKREIEEAIRERGQALFA